MNENHMTPGHCKRQKYMPVANFDHMTAESLWWTTVIKLMVINWGLSVMPTIIKFFLFVLHSSNYIKTLETLNNITWGVPSNLLLGWWLQILHVTLSSEVTLFSGVFFSPLTHSIRVRRSHFNIIRIRGVSYLPNTFSQASFSCAETSTGTVWNLFWR